MFHKNLKYYRLRKSISKSELAKLCGVSPMAITHYENGDRRPSMDMIKALASALDVRVTDFLASRDNNLTFSHGEFRKNSSLTANQEEYIRESVEEYFSRFFTTVELLGGEVLPQPPACHEISLDDDAEVNALEMREHLKLAEEGPIGNLVEILENKGILIYLLDIKNDKFSGMNGFVNEYPYIVLNKNMSAERNRSTAAHELAHLLFQWPDFMSEKECEEYATAISGAFLFSKSDAKRELGIRRTRVSQDMFLVCKEYGISMFMLIKRAELFGIITPSMAKQFYMDASKRGWKKHEPQRIEQEVPTLFEQLVYRAINEEEISIQKGAELLKKSYEEVVENCYFDGDN